MLFRSGWDRPRTISNPRRRGTVLESTWIWSPNRVIKHPAVTDTCFNFLIWSPMSPSSTTADFCPWGVRPCTLVVSKGASVVRLSFPIARLVKEGGREIRQSVAGLSLVYKSIQPNSGSIESRTRKAFPSRVSIYRPTECDQADEPIGFCREPTE